VFNKFSGNLGTQGSLSFLFDHKAVFTFKKKDGLDMDELILELIDFGVEDEYDEDEESEMLSSLTGKSVKSRYLQLTVGYRFNL